MKGFDLVLMALLIGLACFTGFLFTSDYPRDFLQNQGLPFKYAVIHASGDPAHTNQIPTFHFMIARDGSLINEQVWEEKIYGKHTGNEQINRESIGIGLWGDFSASPPSPAQLKTLKHLIGFLQNHDEMKDLKIYLHREVEKGVDCPGKAFPRTF